MANSKTAQNAALGLTEAMLYLLARLPICGYIVYSIDIATLRFRKI
jgi:hypothetical protein